MDQHNNRIMQRLAWLLFFCATAALFYGIFRSSPPPQYFDNSDKVGHIVAFGTTSFLGWLALGRRLDTAYWIVCLMLAGSLEYLQGAWLPLRHYSLADAYANVLGVVGAFASTKSIKIFIKKSNQK